MAYDSASTSNESGARNNSTSKRLRFIIGMMWWNTSKNVSCLVIVYQMNIQEKSTCMILQSEECI